MYLLVIYFFGAVLVFSANYLNELLPIERCFQKAIFWPILLVKTIIKGIRNEL